MKTLTLFSALMGAEAECKVLILCLFNDTITLYGDRAIYEKQVTRRNRLILTLQKALTKRLQEQEEELALLNAYSSDTAVFLHIHGFNYDKWHENYLKEKTNE